MIEKRKPESPQEKESRVRERRLNDLRVILNLPEGRRLVWWILTICKVFVDGYVPGDSGYETTRNTGIKWVGHWLLNLVFEAKPAAFTQMQREHASELKREELVEEEYIEQKDILEPKDE
ncbi:hypothetical protein [Sulfuricurvum sp.]|uniref:hypothetical protein n=1 Tax=Sulfuricurvum sp. TaxID=2025608 RepID=UPI003567D219